jgi:hypothetical protein
MKNQQNTKLFAFQLAKKEQTAKPAAKWQVREGVATAGCTGPDARASGPRGYDNGIWC